ncbi:MAG: HAD family phosphatase [Vulcanimicrobiota bacterium]
MGSLFKSKQAVRTIFFDIGGVVVDAPMAGFLKLGCQFFGCDEETLRTATAQHLGDLETAQIGSEVFWERVCEQVAASGGGSVPAWKFKGFWEGLLTERFHIDQELIDLIRRLKAHCRVAVLSNVIKEHAVILQREKVYEHFNPVILSCNVGLRKPEPKMFEKAAELTKTSLARCLLVDDCVENLEAAARLGWRTHHYVGVEEFRRVMFQMGLLESA